MDRLIAPNLREGAEQPVEYDHHAAIVAVEIGLVRGMVEPVVRGCVEHPFERAERADRLGMQEELIAQIECQQGDDHHRREAEQHQRHIKGPAGGEEIGPAEPQRGEQRHLLG